MCGGVRYDSSDTQPTRRQDENDRDTEETEPEPVRRYENDGVIGDVIAEEYGVAPHAHHVCDGIAREPETVGLDFEKEVRRINQNDV